MKTFNKELEKKEWKLCYNLGFLRFIYGWLQVTRVW